MPRFSVWLAFLLLVPAVAAGAQPAGPGEGSGQSYWGEIPPEESAEAVPLGNNDHPLWEDMIYYPYQVVAWPPRALAGGLGTTVAWASQPQVCRTVTDLVTLDFVPVRGQVGVSAGGGDGFGVSYNLTHDEFLGPDNRMKLGLGRSTERKTKATLGFLFGDGQVNSTSLGLGYRLNPISRYYGIGSDSREENKSYYTNETAWAGLGYKRHLQGDVWFEAGGLYSTAATRGSWSRESESLERTFTATGDRPFGFGDESAGPEISLGLLRDSTRENGRPDSGGIQRLGWAYFTNTDTDADVSFWSERYEVQQFLPLWHTKRGLALRGLYARLHGSGDDPIPFQRLLTNDDPDQFRGYPDLRFRDEGLLSLTAEYRFPAWNYRSVDGVGFDTFLFFDSGQVFGETKEIALRNLTESYGGGVRFLTRGGFMGHVVLGFSEEDWVVRLSAQQMFQYGKGGLLHGRNPIPKR